MNLVLRERDERSPPRCVVCRDDDGVVAVCRGCGTTTHAACAAESHGCPTIGCARQDPLPVVEGTDQPSRTESAELRARLSRERLRLLHEERLREARRPGEPRVSPDLTWPGTPDLPCDAAHLSPVAHTHPALLLFVGGAAFVSLVTVMNWYVAWKTS